MTLSSFTPEKQDEKLMMIGDANMLCWRLTPSIEPTPTEDDVAMAMQKTIEGLKGVSPIRPSVEQLESVSWKSPLNRKKPVFIKPFTAPLSGALSAS